MGGSAGMKKIALFAFNGDPLCFIHVLDEMSGHPSMARYMAEGFEVITF